MKFKIILLLFFTIFISAQTHRFIYEYHFKTDSTATVYEKSNMTLDINPNEIKFYDYEYAVNDSLNKVQNINNQIWNETPVTIRPRNSNDNLNFEYLNDYFTYPSSDLIKWNLTNETKKAGQYNIQKATCNFGGRKWIAWFNPEIPLNEGPYKFRGLPGLIFEVEDSQNMFIFKLAKSYKLKSTYDTSEFLEKVMGKNPLLVNLKTLNKVKLDYYLDPYREKRENFVYNPNETIKLMNIRITSKDQIAEATKSYQKYIRDNNNPIEIDKAIQYPK